MNQIKTLAILAVLAVPSFANADEQSVLVQSTTSTANSGLYEYLLPLFNEQTGIEVRVVAVGTGQAIKNAQNCDGDVLLVHAKPAELQFVEAGYGTERSDLMYNDFILVGPPDDPANLTAATDIIGAFSAISSTGARFASRGDDSGTHKKEMSYWNTSGIDPKTASGEWYLETGSGMGATLNAGIGLGAYVLTDRATWISFGNKQDYSIVFEGDDALFNQYGVIPVNPAHCPGVNYDGAKAFADWLLSETGQTAIAGYTVEGQQLFFPNAEAK
jgi:tungstate transport system substrate-binding protein